MDFKDKKVAVLGLGLEGQDLVRWLLSQKANVTVFDLKTASVLGEVYKEFSSRGVSFFLGPDYLAEGFSGFDFVFRSPGIKPDLPALVSAREKGITVSSPTRLFFDLCPAKIIGVTGTKGKGTTSSLIAQILKTDGRRAFLLGNIGQPAFGFLSELRPDDWVVFELSSFQLQDLGKSPHIGVILFIASDHLDYHATREEYVRAKTAIVRFQSATDFAVINADDPTAATFASLTPAKVFFFRRHQPANGAFVKNGKVVLAVKGSPFSLGLVRELKLLGEHNWDNVCAAIAAASLAGARLKAIEKAVFSFTGLEHRLEPVGEIDGRQFYNDSFSTTPETTIAAIRAFSVPLTLIAGGSEKGAEFTLLGQALAASSVQNLILIGQMTERIKIAALEAGFKGEIVTGLKKMTDIVNKALELSPPKSVILLSPACASFDLFTDYKDRGRQFKQAVADLKHA